MVTTTETHVICNKQLNKHINMVTTTETHVICNKQLNKHINKLGLGKYTDLFQQQEVIY
jgi:tartrate dehydratase alpha subunit/fumarate hydratase class I-like protein